MPLPDLDGQETDERTDRPKAAGKAGVSTTKESDSSPVRSEDHSALLSFGEPSRRMAQVKVTYAAKKSRSPNKSSPLHKASATSPPASPPLAALAFGSKSLSHPRPRARRLPTNSTRSTQLPSDDDDSLPSLTDSDEEHRDSIPSTNPPLRLLPKKATRTMARTMSSPLVGSSGKRSDLKRKRSPTRSGSLESASGLEWSLRRVKPAALSHSSPPPETSQPMASSSRNGVRPQGSPTRPSAVIAPLTSRKLTTTLSLSSLSTVTLPDISAIHPGWGIKDHALVFVRLDELGQISKSNEGMWWPAEVPIVSS